MNELGTDPRPTIALPRDIVPLPLAVGLCAVLAVGLLVFLLSSRPIDEGAYKTIQVPAQKAPPELSVPYEQRPSYDKPFRASVISVPKAPVLGVVPALVRPPVAEYAERVPPFSDDLPEDLEPDRSSYSTSSAGAIVIDLWKARGTDPSPSYDTENPDSRSQETDVIKATQIRGQSFIIPQGTIIAAVLETPLNSDRPGLARAVISQDVRSFNGARILIPRGSRLIGEFKAETGPGLRRIPVIWTRLIRPDGVAIRIASPSADPLGGAGVGGSVNSHFAARLLGAVLQSTLSVGVNLLSASANSAGNPVYVGLPGQVQQAGEQLLPKVDRSPTIKVKPGTEVSVLVARDLDFSGTPPVR